MSHTTYKPENLVMPFVHINGTGAKSLCDQREAVWEAIEATRHAFCQMAPNARDYYPYNDPEKMEAALEQHIRRLRVLNELQDEMTAEMEHIMEHGRLYHIPREG
jgi:hypothetical protein